MHSLSYTSFSVSLLSLLPTQDLLQLQYEGLAIMKMFGRAKVNVNLLIFLINKIDRALNWIPISKLCSLTVLYVQYMCSL